MMEWVSVGFAISVLLYLGLIVGLWWFWYPRDPLKRQQATSGAGALRQAVISRHLPPQPVPEGLYLHAGEDLLQQSPASLYRSRSDAPVVGAAVGIDGGGWLFGAQRNKAGYDYRETGTLYLTNRRLLFVGPHETLSVPIPELVRLEAEAPWLTVWSGQDRKTVRFRLGEAGLWREALTIVHGRPPEAA